MRVLIIGGAGVLGQITTPALAERHTVRVLDLARPSVPGVESVVGDATSPDDVAAAMDGVDGVIHQAAVVPRGAQADDPDRVSAAFAVNVASVHLAATTAVRLGVTAFVHVSTMAVFGSYGVRRLTDDDLPDATHPYGLTKRLGEAASAAVLAEPAPVMIGACSLRFGHPTPDVDWPRWRPPVGAVTDVAMSDGTPLPALSGTDAAAALDAALAYSGQYRAFTVTGDSSGAAADQSSTAETLGWRPRPCEVS